MFITRVTSLIAVSRFRKMLVLTRFCRYVRMYVCSTNECKCNNLFLLIHSSVSSSVSFIMYVCILARFLLNRNVSFSVIYTKVSCTYVCPYDCIAQALH